MGSLGFENYAEALKVYLTKYREVIYPISMSGLDQINANILISRSNKTGLIEIMPWRIFGVVP